MVTVLTVLIAERVEQPEPGHRHGSVLQRFPLFAGRGLCCLRFGQGRGFRVWFWRGQRWPQARQGGCGPGAGQRPLGVRTLPGPAQQPGQHHGDRGLVGVIDTPLGGDLAGVPPGEVGERLGHHRQVGPRHGDPPAVVVVAHPDPGQIVRVAR